MAYRDDSEPLKERALSLSRELEQVRTHARSLANEECAILDELDRVHAQLRPPSPPISHTHSNGLLIAIVASGACAVLAFAAIARIMTSEIAPFEIQTAAYNQAGATNAAMAPLESAPQPTLVDSDERVGFLRIDAPMGSRIYENDRFLGTAPLVVLLSDGTHSIRAVTPSGVACTKLGVVRDRALDALQFPNELQWALTGPQLASPRATVPACYLHARQLASPRATVPVCYLPPGQIC